MGVSGPIPKRSSERRRRNKENQPVKALGAAVVEVPEPDPKWHPIAQRLFKSLAESGQSAFYEPSDWAFAYSLLDDLSYFKKRKVRSAQMLAAILSAFDRLLITEGDRRRARIELQRPDPEGEESGQLVVLNDYREALGG